MAGIYCWWYTMVMNQNFEASVPILNEWNVLIFLLFYNDLDLNNQKILCLPSIFQFERKVSFWTTLLKMNNFFLGLEMPKGKKLADLFLDHSISLGYHYFVSLVKKIVSPEQGLEPWTFRLKAWRSTNWATRATWRYRPKLKIRNGFEEINSHLYATYFG